MHPKENYPLSKANPSRRFSYSSNIDEQNKNPNPAKEDKKHRDRICELQERLQEQENKYKKLEQATIKEQMHVLEQINLLEQRFNEVTLQKQYYRKKYEQFKQNIEDYKKIKGISSAMTKMYNKVEREPGDLHTSWKWVKKVVMEYQIIKTKAFDWKKGYDAFMAMTSITNSQSNDIERADTFSDCSESIYN